MRAASRITTAALLALAACAGARGARGPASGALDALVLRNDGAAAQAKAAAVTARRPDDPWACLAAALAARRALDRAGETSSLLALARAAPDHPLALVALRRLSELADDAPERARAVEAALAPLVERGRFGGLAAYRARVARVAAAEVLGDHERVARLRRENGAVSAWTIAGPFGVHRAMDFDRRWPPDEGTIPATVPGPFGLPARPARALPVPDGTVALEGEPLDGDVFALAADATLARGGDYLVAVGTSMSARVTIDGVLVHERRAFAAHLPTLVNLPLALSSGRHRIVVVAARAGGASAIHVALARADGAPSDATFAPAAPGPTPARSPGASPLAPALPPRALARALEPHAGPVLARFLAAREATSQDRESAKALLAEAAASVPASAAIRVARADVLSSDPTLDPQVAASRAETELREALARDPGHAEARIALAALLRSAGRLDEADEVLAGLEAPAAGRPAAIEARARAADARGLAERAEALAAEALRAGGSCSALDLARELAARRAAVDSEDERARALAECRDGRERLAEHLRRRGDPRGAASALAPVVRARPWAVEPAFALSSALVAAGDPARAAEVLEELRAVWPRSPRIEKRLAETRELAGDAKGSRAARERALLLDGSDLSLRRALAAEEGREVLDDLAEDARAAIRAYEAARRSDDTSSAMVLDAAAVELHPGGTATERTHQVIHVLDQQGVEQFGEIDVPAGAEVLALRTIKPDGRSIEPERAGEGKGSVSLAGLEPGDYVHVEFVRGIRGDGTGLDARPFYFRAQGTRLFRSTYVVAAPARLGLEIEAHGIAMPPIERHGGRDVARIEARDVPAWVPEPAGPSATEVLPYVNAGIGDGRDALQRSLADAFADRSRPTEEIRALAREIRAAAGAGATAPTLARAAWAHVARTILGHGGTLGDEASIALSRGRGSRLLVLKAVLAELGIRARIALVRAFSADPAPRRFPGRGLYSDPLLRIEAGGETAWQDAALRLAPFGTITSGACDAEALILPEPGEALEVARTPPCSVEERREVAVKIVLDADGSASVEGDDRFFGAAGAAAKTMVERLDASERRQAVEGMLARSFRGIAVGEIRMSGEADPEAPFAIRFRGRVPSLARRTGAGFVLETPIMPERLGAHFVQTASRTTPLLLSAPERVIQRFQLTAPEGLIAAAAAPRSVDGPFGSFTRSERAEGHTLLREDRIDLHRARIAPNRYADFAAFAAAVDAVQEAPTVFQPDPGSSATPRAPAVKAP